MSEIGLWISMFHHKEVSGLLTNKSAIKNASQRTVKVNAMTATMPNSLDCMRSNASTDFITAVLSPGKQHLSSSPKTCPRLNDTDNFTGY